MEDNNRNKPRRKCTSEAQKIAIRRNYAIRARNAKLEALAVSAPGQSVNLTPVKKSAVGKIYRGETKYIDKEPKKQRNYVVVRDTPRGVSVAKLKTIKQFDEHGKNADRALVEINHERYDLPNRTGVDFQTYNKNLMSGKPIKLEDKDVFPEDRERAVLSNRDKSKVLIHTGVKKPNRRKKRE